MNFFLKKHWVVSSLELLWINLLLAFTCWPLCSYRFYYYFKVLYNPRQMGHGGEVWQNVVHWRREWQTTSVFLLWEPHEQYEKAKWLDTEREFPRSVGTQYATEDQWRNNSRKNEGMEPKQKQYPVVDVTGDRSKVRCCKEQYCIGTWNLRSMNQGKLEVVK